MGRWEQWTATYRVVTPMFCAGADPTTPEIRASSFKGVLRFWWRALAWGWYGGDLKEIRTEEERIFGGPGTGQSRVRVVLLHTRNDEGFSQQITPGLTYLAGMGLASPRGQLVRPALKPGIEFTLTLVHDLKGTGAGRLRAALECVGLFGGLGSRSRRGFGSLWLETIQTQNGTRLYEPPSDLESLREYVASLLASSGTASRVPEYTAFSSHARIVAVMESTEDSTPIDLLDHLGREFLRFRSWGRAGKDGEYLNVLGETPEQNFRQDHDQMRGFVEGKIREPRAPERVIFGLPHNYHFSSLEPPWEIEITAEHHTRRASPLFFHVGILDDKPVGVLAFLKARFLPTGEVLRLVAKEKKKRNHQQGGASPPQTRSAIAPTPQEETLWTPIVKFLQRIEDGEGPEPFATTRRLWP